MDGLFGEKRKKGLGSCKKKSDIYTFEEFLIEKYPLWGVMNVDDIRITVKDMKEIVSEWQQQEKEKM